MLRRRRSRTIAFVVLLPLFLLPLLLALFVRLNSDELFRLFLVRTLRDKVGGGVIGASGAPVSIGSASFSIRGGTTGGDGATAVDGKPDKKGTSWSFELRHLHIGNVPRGDDGDGNAHRGVAIGDDGESRESNQNPGDGERHDDGWSVPYALHLSHLRLTLSGPLAFLSLLQIPIASSLGAPSLPRKFADGLDFMGGFRVREIDVLEIGGLTVCLEDAEDADDIEGGEGLIRLPINPEAVIRRGFLRRGRDSNRKREKFDFVLEPARLSWFEPGKLDELLLPPLDRSQQQEREMEDGAEEEPSVPRPTKTRPRAKLRVKPRGSVRLYASSSVEVLIDSDGEASTEGQSVGVSLDLELISDTDCLVLRASSVEERDAWASALRGAVSDLAAGRRSGSGSGDDDDGNAPWLKALAADGNARKMRWRRRELRERNEWRRRWRSEGKEEREVGGGGDGGGDGKTDGEKNDHGETRSFGGNNVDEEDENDDLTDDAKDDWGGERDGEDLGEGGVNFLDALRNLHFARRLNAQEQRLEDVLEWRIGRLEVRGLDLHVNGRHLGLADDDGGVGGGGGWALRGFLGSGAELKRRLNFGLLRKVLKDSGGRALKTGIRDYTGKDEYVFGDLTKSTVNKVGAGVAAGVSGFTGKQEYQFGDVTKTAAKKVGAGVAAGVSGFTGKDEYQFGDVTKTAVKKVGAGVAAGVSGFTRKQEYQFGDVTKAVLAKLVPRKAAPLEANGEDRPTSEMDSKGADECEETNARTVPKLDG